MGAISFADLDHLSGEVLPERTVLATVSGGTGSASSAAAASGGDGGSNGATAMNACQTTYSPGTPGLLGSLGLGSSNPYSTTTCTPAAISSH
jgi:hypothetical protein